MLWQHWFSFNSVENWVLIIYSAYITEGLLSLGHPAQFWAVTVRAEQGLLVLPGLRVKFLNKVWSRDLLRAYKIFKQMLIMFDHTTICYSNVSRNPLLDIIGQIQCLKAIMLTLLKLVAFLTARTSSGASGGSRYLSLVSSHFCLYRT